MDQEVNDLGKWVGYAVGALAVLFSFWQNWRKTDVDESALILGKWKELVDTHKQDITDLKTDFAIYKAGAVAEIAALSLRLTVVEREFSEYRVRAAKEISHREDEIAGLRRAILQNSASTVIELGKTDQRVTDLDAVGTEANSDLRDRVDRLDAVGGNSRGRSPDDGD